MKKILEYSKMEDDERKRVKLEELHSLDFLKDSKHYIETPWRLRHPWHSFNSELVDRWSVSERKS